jgi:hypothetical protein
MGICERRRRVLYRLWDVLEKHCAVEMSVRVMNGRWQFSCTSHANSGFLKSCCCMLVVYMGKGWDTRYVDGLVGHDTAWSVIMSRR